MHELVIQDAPGKGRGVFAARDFVKGELVCEYEGQLLTREEADARSFADDLGTPDSCVCEEGCYMFWFSFKGNTMCIDARVDDGSFGRLINHSKKNANIFPRTSTCSPKIMFYTLRKISAGEELLYNYGENDPAILAKFSWLCN